MKKNQNNRISQGEKTANIYMMLPRFVAEPLRKAGGDRHLPAIFRDFDWNGVQYKFIISPATVYREEIGEKHYYPGEREKMIESGLRELAVTENPNFLGAENTLYFSFSQLRRELNGMTGGSRYNENEIKLGLDILADAKYELHKGSSELCFRPIEELTIREKNGETYYLAIFSSLFLNRIEAFNFCFNHAKSERSSTEK